MNPEKQHRTFEAPEIVHLCPPKGSGIMPCCGKTPFEVSRMERMTLKKKGVTCPGRKEFTTEVFEALMAEAIWNWSRHDARLVGRPRKAAALKGWVKRRWRRRWNAALRAEVEA